jgi:hypothetical protein
MEERLFLREVEALLMFFSDELKDERLFLS